MNGIAKNENGWDGEPIPSFPVKVVTPKGEVTHNMDFGNNDESEEEFGLKKEDRVVLENSKDQYCGDDYI